MIEAIRELLCQRCGKDYPVWCAPNELWNRVQRDGEHFFCLTCFAILAEERGVKTTAWKLELETEADGALQHELSVLRDLVRRAGKIHIGDDIYLCNRANGVRGNWCVGKKYTSNLAASGDYFQYWTGTDWSGFGKLYTDVLEATQVARKALDARGK